MASSALAVASLCGLAPARSAIQVSEVVPGLLGMTSRAYETFRRRLVLTTHYGINHVAARIAVVKVRWIHARFHIASVTRKFRPATVRLVERKTVRPHALSFIADVPVARLFADVAREQPAPVWHDLYLVEG